MNPISGQWISFDLSETTDNHFKKQSEPIIRSSILSLGQLSIIELSETNRVGISLLFPIGWDVTNLSIQSNPHVFLPLAEGKILVTNNLVLKGKMNFLSPKNGAVNAAGYGMEYQKQNWVTSVSFGWLEGPMHIRVKAVDFSFIMKKSISDIPLHFGIGHNNYQAYFRNINVVAGPSRLENSLTYFVAGTQFHWDLFDIDIQTQAHPKFIQFNFQIMKSFF